MTAQHKERRERAEKILKEHGYGVVKDIADHEIGKAVSEHDNQRHGGKKTHLKLKHGGAAKGKTPEARLDRKPRAAGGRNKGHKEPKVSVNVINAGGKQPMPMPPAPMGAAPHAPMPMPPQAAPAGPPPMGGAPMPPHPMPPQGAMPGGMPQRPFKGGGPVRSKMEMPHLNGGAGGGLGRLEKAAAEAKRKKAV